MMHLEAGCRSHFRPQGLDIYSSTRTAAWLSMTKFFWMDIMTLRTEASLNLGRAVDEAERFEGSLLRDDWNETRPEIYRQCSQQPLMTNSNKFSWPHVVSIFVEPQNWNVGRRCDATVEFIGTVQSRSIWNTHYKISHILKKNSTRSPIMNAK